MNKLLCILLLSFFALCSCRLAQEEQITPSGDVVRIGVIAPLSGPDKKSGEMAMSGIRTALQLQPYLNNGDKIELVTEDSQGTPEKTLTALASLSVQDDVSAILLMGKSDTVLAAVPVADQYKIPVLALIATHPDITQDNNFISQLGFDDIFQGTVAALYARDELLVQRAAVFSDPSNAHYSFLANEFIRKFSSVGGEIIEHISDVSAADDLQHILERLRKNKVQFLYMAVASERVIELARAANNIGWHPMSMGSDGLLASMILKHREDSALIEGMMATDFYSDQLPKTAYGKKVISIYNKLFSGTGTTYSGLGSEGTSILLAAMERCDNKQNRSCVNYMLRHTEGFEGLFGKITIRGNGKTERPIFVNVIEDQTMKFLIKVY